MTAGREASKPVKNVMPMIRLKAAVPAATYLSVPSKQGRSMQILGVTR